MKRSLTVPLKDVLTNLAPVAGAYGPSLHLEYDDVRAQSDWQPHTDDGRQASLGAMGNVTPYRLVLSYQTYDELWEAAGRANLSYQLTVSDGVKVISTRPGSGPALVYEETGGALPVFNCLTLTHPYWKEVEGIVNPTEPGATSVDNTFVPGVSNSSNMTPTPSKPKVIPPDEPTTPQAPQGAPRGPETRTQRKIVWGTDQIDTNGVLGQDTVQFPLTIPAGVKALFEFSAVDYPAGGTPHNYKILRADGSVAIDSGPNLGTSVYGLVTIPEELPSGATYFLAIQNHGEDWRHADIRLETRVTVRP